MKRPSKQPPPNGTHRLNQLTQSVLAQELNKAFFRAGKQLLTLYLEQLVETEALAICRNPALLRDTINKILTDREAEAVEHKVESPLTILAQSRTQPMNKTRELISFIESTIHTGPIEGMLVDDLRKLIKDHLGRTMTHTALVTTLRRNNEIHKLVIRGNRVRLRSDIMVDILTRRHKPQQLSVIINETRKPHGPIRNAARRKV